MTNCRCKKTINLNLKISKELSFHGRDYWKICKIDRCIAPLVQALQNANIDMKGSCCGHGENDGFITLCDGKELIIRGE